MSVASQGIGRRASLAAALALAWGAAGCRYCYNRAADARDVLALGAGVTRGGPAEKKPWFPAMGLYAQATEFLGLGWIRFEGRTAECDGRGLFAGPEIRRRWAWGLLQSETRFQDYERGQENYFKREEGMWARRMKPGKTLAYSKPDHKAPGGKLLPRGWQYWSTAGLEMGLSEPIGRLGFQLRAGFDVMELADFVLGLAMIDMSADDVTAQEYEDRAAYSKGPEALEQELFGKKPGAGAERKEKPAEAQGLKPAPAAQKGAEKRLLVFFTPSDAYCQMQLKALEEIEPQLSKSAQIERVNLDQQPQKGKDWGVYLIPTIILIEDGNETRLEGFCRAESLERKLLKGQAPQRAEAPKPRAESKPAALEPPLGGKTEERRLVLFYAPENAFCQKQLQALEEVEARIAKWARIERVNLREQPQKGQEWEISRIPTMVVLENGKPAKWFFGFYEGETVASYLEGRGG